MKKTRFLILAAINVGLANSAQADVVAYTQKCGMYGHMSYNLTCAVEKDTIKDFTYGVGVKSVTICATYDNRGGMGKTLIVHNSISKEDDQELPTDQFETVKFKGRDTGGPNNSLSWEGTSSRLMPGMTAHGEARWVNKPGADSIHLNGTYLEVLIRGGRPVGEIRANCNSLPGADD